jgi:2-hydroxychromene-2-carboxylate isomerase
VTKATTKATAKAVAYFSLRSPYSWLAHHRALRLPGGGLPPEVEHVPYWEPDADTTALLEERRARHLYTPMSRAKHFYILHDVRRLAAELDLVLRWPVDRDPWWDLPHLAALVAARAGRGAEFRAAAYRARWEEGRDICTREVVADVAERAGVDPDAAAGAPEDPQVRAEGAAALARAHRDGVFGVPFFRAGREPFWGVDRFGAFVAALGTGPAALDPAPPDPAPSDPAAVVAAAGGDGHAGGCG